MIHRPPIAWQPSTEVRSTGLSLVDDLIGGGVTPGEPNFILGPIASGKTLLATMIAVEGAWREEVSRRTNPGCWVYLTSSQRPREIRNWAESYLAMLPRGPGSCGLEKVTRETETWNWLRHQDRMSRFGDAKPEQRLQVARTALARRLLIVNAYLPTGDNSNLSTQITSLVESALERAGQNHLAGVVVDSLWVLAHQYHFNQSADWQRSHHLSPLIRKAVRGITWEIGRRYCCPIWLTHLLVGRASTEAHRTYTHRDAMDCKVLGDVASIAVVLSERDPLVNAFCARCTLSPLAARASEPVLIRFATSFAGFEPAAGCKLINGRMVSEATSTVSPVIDAAMRKSMEAFVRDASPKPKNKSKVTARKRRPRKQA
jgi:KaiC/GvpD/RAD55 family RecA-like ATPase